MRPPHACMYVTPAQGGLWLTPSVSTAIPHLAHAGLIDLLGNLIELPRGTERFFLSLGFMLQAFVVSEWNYGSMLAGNLYYLVYLLSAGAVYFILAEIVWPHSFFVSCGR